MTARLPFTRASVRRRIAAAQDAGLRVVGIAPDGTVLTAAQDGDKPPAGVPNSHVQGQIAPPSPRSKWEDAEA